MRSLLVLLLLPLALRADDWPQWRGPNRDGISRETGLLPSWPAGGPPLIWKTSGLGEGFSSFSVVKNRLYTLGQRGDKQYLMAFDTDSGRKVWETAFDGGSYRERRGNGPRGTPSVDGDRVYALSAEGVLMCAELSSGRRIWSVNAVQQYGGRIIHWGISESPLIDGDHVIVMPGGRGASLVALDKRTGKLVWKGGNDEAGYSSAIVVDIGGIRQIVTLSAEAALGVNADNGEVLWRYDKVSNQTANIATPLHRDGHVFVSTDYGTGCALLKLTPAGTRMRADEVYFNRDMRNHYATSVLVGDYLYGFSSQVLTAMKFLTGEVAWRDRSVGKGQVIFADGHLYCFGERGTVGLIAADPSGYKEKSRFQIDAGEYPTWAVPVIAHGRLYLREQDRLYAYDIRARR